MTMVNSTEKKKYLLRIENYPQGQEFDEDIITLMALAKFEYNDIEKKKKEFFDKYKEYYSTRGAKQRKENYEKYEKDAIITTQGNRKYESAAPVQLDQMIKIYESHLTDEQKIVLMHDLFLTPEDFFDRFKDLYPVFMDTERMKKFADVYAFISKKQNKFTYEKLEYMDSIKPMLEIYPQALEVMNDFINTNCGSITEYITSKGITRTQFDHCLEALQILRPNLYMEALEAKQAKQVEAERKQKEIYAANSAVIGKIIFDINQCNKNNENFDLLEFYKRIPFKSKEYFINEVIEFTKRAYPGYVHILVKYIYSNGLNARSRIVPIDFKSLGNPNNFVTVDNVVFNGELDLALVDYLREKGYPICNNTLRIARRKYVDGELDFDREQNKVIKKVKVEDE